MRKFSFLLAVIAIVLAILACNLPSGNPDQQGTDAILTAAALTVQAELGNGTSATPTFTPLAPFPTSPLPTFAPPTLPPASPTSSCDNAQFITDVTYPDNTVVTPSTNFTKTWRLKNTGTCSWTPSYAVVYFLFARATHNPVCEMLSHWNRQVVRDLAPVFASIQPLGGAHLEGLGIML